MGNRFQISKPLFPTDRQLEYFLQVETLDSSLAGCARLFLLDAELNVFFLFVFFLLSGCGCEIDRQNASRAPAAVIHTCVFRGGGLVCTPATHMRNSGKGKTKAFCPLITSSVAGLLPTALAGCFPSLLLVRKLHHSPFFVGQELRLDTGPKVTFTMKCKRAIKRLVYASASRETNELVAGVGG